MEFDDWILLLFSILKAGLFIFCFCVFINFILTAHNEQLIKFIATIVSAHYLTWSFKSK